MVAIQADSGWSQRGIVTGAFMFSRILGQAIGAAAFGGILNARLSPYLSGEEDLVSRIISPDFRRSLAPDVIGPLMAQFDGALHTIFLIMVGFAVAVLMIGLSLPPRRGLKS
jgi:Na+/melibiose symporter-like transporter